MNKRRISRISSEIKRVVSQLLLDSIKDPRIDPMTSITEVDVTNDLSYATIYISVLGSDDKKKDALDGFDNAKGFIKKELGDRLDLRHIPDLIFEIDNTYEQGARIDELINKIHEEDKNE